jgi:hypothetical protein
MATASVASAFVEALAHRDPVRVWTVIDGQLRLCFAQVWAHRAGLTPQDADEIAASGSADARWSAVAVAMLEGLTASVDHFVEVTLAGRLGLYSRMRPVGLDLEEVVFVDDGGATETITIKEDRPIVGLRVFVRATPDGQRVAGLKGSIPTPGWPPNMNARVDDDQWIKPSDTN